jgi:hypothetical protein
MWNMQFFVIPIIIRDTGIVSKGLKNLETIPGQHSIDSLQKTAILGTSRIIREVLQSETWSLNGGIHLSCSWTLTIILWYHESCWLVLTGALKVKARGRGDCKLAPGDAGLRKTLSSWTLTCPGNISVSPGHPPPPPPGGLRQLYEVVIAYWITFLGELIFCRWPDLHGRKEPCSNNGRAQESRLVLAVFFLIALFVKKGITFFLRHVCMNFFFSRMYCYSYIS